MRNLTAISPPPTRRIAVSPPDRWQKRWRTVWNIRSRRTSALLSLICARLPRKQVITINAAPAPGAQEPQDELGRQIFEGACVNCHQYNGDGRQTVYASLVGSRSVPDPDGGNVTQIMLGGAKYRIKDHNVYMPPFGRAYSDAELAAVANYVIGHFGGKTGRVTPEAAADFPRQGWVGYIAVGRSAPVCVISRTPTSNVK
jgi:mono/diheme cytochrome c family protein